MMTKSERAVALLAAKEARETHRVEVLEPLRAALHAAEARDQLLYLDACKMLPRRGMDL